MLSFYFSLADYRRSTYRDLLFSFLLQLLYMDDVAFESTYVRRLYSQMEWTPEISSPDLHRLLCAILIRLSGKPVFCIINALDECDEESRGHLVGDFKRIMAKRLTSCRVIITCQPTDCIRALLGPFGENSINLDEKMETARGILLTKELNDDKFVHVRDALEKANASPLKVKLVAHLASLGETPDVSKYVEYDAIYKRILTHIEAPPLWLRDVLLCISFTKRPLTVSKLAAALGVNHTESANTSPQSLQKIRVLAPKQLQEDLKLTLGFLIRVKNNIIHLVHNTLRDFIRAQPNFLS